MPVSSTLVQSVLTPILRPVTRLLIGVIAIPCLRLVRRQVPRLREWDAEMEKDVEQWFRGALLLLVATKNFETALMGWLNQFLALQSTTEIDLNQWYITAGRLLLAIGVVEAMPDQELFAIIHPGPRLRWLRGKGVWRNLREQASPFCRGLVCKHLKRSSPLFAILTVFFGGPLGWLFYAVACVQYLIIGLVTSRDRALDVLSRFDQIVAERRQEIIEEFELPDAPAPATEGTGDARPPKS
jgi:hypothetical protein